MNIREFLQKLVDCLPRSAPKESALEEFWRVLEKKDFTSESLSVLFDELIGRHKFFPSLSEILEAARDTELRPGGNGHVRYRMRLFRLDGYEKAERVPIGVDVPPPAGATDVRWIDGPWIERSAQRNGH